MNVNFSARAETQKTCMYSMFSVSSMLGHPFFNVTSGLRQTCNYFNWLLQNCCSTSTVIISTSLNTQVVDFGKYKVQILLHVLFYIYIPLYISTFTCSLPSYEDIFILNKPTVR